MTKKRIRITDGGIALPLGDNTFLMKGRLHSQGGIGIGNGGKNDIEVEDGEVVKFNKDNIQVLSDQPMLNGISPANALLAGGNFNKIFKAQQSINGNHKGSYGRDGLIKKLIGFFTGNDEKENTNKENKKDAPIDWDEIKIKQAYTESGFNSKAVSRAPAYGLYQVTPQTLKEFNDKTGNNYKIEDLYNDEINTEIRDWYMNDLYNREWNTKNNPSDSVRATKTIMAYNMGPTNLVNRLNELKAKGYDIYKSLDWTQDDSIPVESREYNDFILRNIDNSISRNQIAYETSKKKNSDKVEGIRKGFKEGGETSVPTKEEYITKKLDSIRSNALERSRKKTNKETTILNESNIYGRKAVVNRLQNLYNSNLYLYNTMLENIYNNYKKNNPIISEKYTNLDFIENDVTLKSYKETLDKSKKLLEDAKNGKYNGRSLSNCIANLSEFYPHGLPYGNQTFKTNHKKYGFSLIDTWDVKPGDLVQHLYLNGTPEHAMIYNGIDDKGNHTFNYSDGREPINGIGGYKTGKYYPPAVTEDGKHLWDVDVYRYTGTPQDSIQWSNEYDQKYGKTLKNGGQINMKLKHKNKQDITDIVMNEILPHSTGERKKFSPGGVWGVSEWSLAGNLGLNLLSGLTQGIIGSVTSNKLRKMYDNMKRKSTYIPVAREHINTKVDVEPQLSATKLAEQKLIDNAQANTSSSKVARQQAREAVANRIATDNQIYGDKYNKETQLRNAEAELQTRYNLVDSQNKLADIREQNDFDLQKSLGKANASIMESQTWGNAVASTLGNSATTLTDYATMTNDLLKSNNPAAYDQWFKSNYGHLFDKNGKLKVGVNKDARIQWFNANKAVMDRLGWTLPG